MNRETIIFIDRLFFLPYRFFRFLFAKFSDGGHNSQQGQILTIKLMGLGSITFFASLCEEKKVDKSTITLLTFDSNRELCKLMGFVNIISIRHSNLFIFLWDCGIAVVKARKLKPILIVDFERCSNAVGLFRMMIAFLTPSEVVCFENIDQHFFLKRLKAYSAKITIEQMYLLAIERMEKSEVQEQRKIVYVENNKILVNCNSSRYMLGRRYPDQEFISVIESIHQDKKNVEFFFTGSGSENEYVERMVSTLKAKGVAASNMAGIWSFQNFCDELKSCRLLITCDSFPLHLATYLRIPTIAIWGPTQPEQFGYQNNELITNVSLKMSCSPCLLHLHSAPTAACKGNITCMKNLRSSQIANQALDLLLVNNDTRSIKTLSHYQSIV